MHSHDFSAFLLVRSGAFTLVTEDGAVTHRVGDTCEVAAGTRHSERTDESGAVVLVGRK